MFANEDNSRRFVKALVHLSRTQKVNRCTERSNDVCVCRHQVGVMFANEDNSRRFVKALVRMNRTQDLKLLASDSWGAKIHPVYGQEEAGRGHHYHSGQEERHQRYVYGELLAGSEKGGESMLVAW